MKTLVIIPSRLSATRLPGKPLLKINGLSIIGSISFGVALDAGRNLVPKPAAGKTAFFINLDSPIQCFVYHSKH